MSVSLLAALAGLVLALASLVVLVMRCARAPRLVLLAWTGAVFGVALSLAAQAAGFAAGFSSLTFRVSQIGLLAAGGLTLVLGLGEAAGRSAPARFAVRLTVSGLGVILVVILATDPLSEEPFGKTFPAAAVHYQPISNALLSYALGPFVTIAALVAVACTAVRARKDPAWRATLPAVAGGSVAALAAAAPALSKLLSDRLGLSLGLTAAFPFLCIAVVGLTWWSVVKVSGLRLEVVHEGVDYPREDTGEWERPRSWSGGPGTGEFDPYTDGGGYPPSSNFPPYQPGLPSPALSSPALSSPGLPQPAFAEAGPGQPPGGGIMPGGPPMPPVDDPAAWARLVGQIVIFTLLDGSVPVFDAMIGSVTEQVRAGEPGTLVFIVHAVPSAPQQRILYEVYRDRDAYQAHQQQPYLMRFEQDRREHVLATNVIELSLQPAKVSQLPALGPPGPAGGPPLPALSQPLSDLPPMGAAPGIPPSRAAGPGAAPPPAPLPPASLPSASRPGLSSPGLSAPGLSAPGRPGPGLAPAASVPSASANGGSGHGRPAGPPAGLPPSGSLASLPSLGAPLPPGGMFPPMPLPYADGPSPGGPRPPGPPSGYGPSPGGPGPQDPYAVPPRSSGQHPYDGPPPYDNGPPGRDEPPYRGDRPYQGDRNGRPPRRGDQDGGYDGGHRSGGYQNGSGRP
ncbi:MAG TPA: antibiotic biosynthesis monooxygenase [Streptosporangiaceae bacterium]